MSQDEIIMHYLQSIAQSLASMANSGERIADTIEDLAELAETESNHRENSQ